MAMNSCINKCLCARCKMIKNNCAECEHSVEKTRECVTTGIKECKYLIDMFKEASKESVNK